MRCAGGVFAESAVDQEFADFQGLFFAGFHADFHGAPLSQHNGVWLRDGKTATSQQQKADEYA
jgi:hypothetical protein